MTQEIIIIDNLKCGGCANTVNKQLLGIEGVNEVEVDLKTSTINIKKSKNVTRDVLLDKLSKLGYPEAGTSNLVQKVKSYVSCAIGRLEK